MASQPVFTQNSRAFLLEPVFRLYIPTESRWAFSVGAAHRGLLLEPLEAETGEEDYEHQHLELNGFTQYNLNDYSHLALRLRYRLRNIFDDEDYDEMRIIQQYFFMHDDSVLKWWHRARFEQRLQHIRTVFRWRYRVGILPPLSNTFALSASTGALYSVSKRAKPEIEQRFYLGLQNNSFRNVDLNVGVELRMMDYLNQLNSEYFLFTSVMVYL